ncbi:MAG: pyruvoyl-dependent arginine decarboxylase [Candidatus Geothermarchaeales archaeon]
MLLPSRYATVSGVGVSETSPLNAFDNALQDCELGDYNLVPVSSIIPKEAVRVDRLDLEPGSIVFVVMAKAEGYGGQKLSAGLAWAKPEGRIGIVMELHRVDPKEETTQELLEKDVREASKARGLPDSEIRFLETSLDVPNGHFGCVICCLALTLQPAAG